MTDEILSQKSPVGLLAVWEKEKDEAGWYTAIVLINRMAKVFNASRHKVSPTDPKVEDVLSFLMTALEQGNMSSRGRLGHPTPDLTDLKKSCEKLRFKKTAMYAALCELPPAGAPAANAPAKSSCFSSKCTLAARKNTSSR